MLWLYSMTTKSCGHNGSKIFRVEIVIEMCYMYMGLNVIRPIGKML